MMYKMMFAMVVSMALLGCGKKASAESSATAVVETAAPVIVPPEPEKPKRHPALDATTWNDAFTLAKTGDVTPTSGNSHGTVVFTVWALDNMKWADVSVAQDETSFAKIMKDSEAERGKRLCVGSTIIQIAVDRSVGKPIYSGLLMTGARNIVHFEAVGSTGDIVEDSHARFCGVVTGRYSYSNSGGGIGHGIQMVGMFDLPDNRKK